MEPEQADGRAWTQDAVENSWVKAADISFTGWAACKPSSEGIRIIVEDSGPRVMQLGRGLAGQPNGMVLNFSFENWGVGCASEREHCIRALAVHEFGHAIGLAHEHNRDDRDMCAAEKQGPSPTFTVTAFDPSSIMNYCAKDWNNGGKLSPLDVAGVRMIYGPFTEDTPATANVQVMMEFYDLERGMQSFEITESIRLSNKKPSHTQTFWQCSNIDRALRIDLQTALTSGRAAIAVTMNATLVEAANCEEGGAILETWADEFDLIQPFSDDGKTALSGLGGYYEMHSHYPDSAVMGATNFSLLAYRSIGKDVVSQSCSDCVSASAETVFSSPETRTLPSE